MAFKAPPYSKLTKCFQALDMPEARLFAKYLQRRQADTETEDAWKNLLVQFQEAFPSDSAKSRAAEAWVRTRSVEGLSLLLWHNRENEQLLEAMAQNAKRLPLGVQKALLCLPAANIHVEKNLHNFAVSAQRLASGNAEDRAQAAAEYAVYIHQLITTGSPE